jgi:hypothetical protein
MKPGDLILIKKNTLIFEIHDKYSGRATSFYPLYYLNDDHPAIFLTKKVLDFFKVELSGSIVYVRSVYEI